LRVGALTNWWTGGGRPRKHAIRWRSFGNSTPEDQDSDAIRSVAKALTASDPGRKWTIREIAEYARIGGD
jgi:hypothetical protein